jgi:hypothetical protein
MQDFDYADWRSNFDMTEDRWFDNYDFSYLFPVEWEHQGSLFVCDAMEETCWTFIEDTEEVCDLDWNCYTVEEALRIYFEGELENWDYGYEFNWDDWRSNFDMNEDRWWLNYDMSVIFPHSWEDGTITWACDDQNSCWTYNEETQEACNYEGECFTPEEALRVYFEGDMIEHFGIVHAENLGWCLSDLDEEPYSEYGIYSVEECWTACV